MPPLSKSFFVAALLLSLPAVGSAQLLGTTTPKEAPSSATTTPAEFPACPIEALREAYSSLLSEQDTFNMLAVEEQVLLVCRERQQLILAYKAGVETIAAGLSELATQNEDLIAAQGNLKDILAETQAAKEDLEALNLKLWEAKEAERAFTDADTSAREAANSKHTPAAPTSTDAASEPNSCSARYAVLGVGAKAGKPYAMLADELRGTSVNATIGEDLPFGVKVVSIDDLKVTADTPNGRVILPTASGAWEGDGNRNTDGLIWQKVDPSAGPDDMTRKPVEVQVFRGFD